MSLFKNLLAMAAGKTTVLLVAALVSMFLFCSLQHWKIKRLETEASRISAALADSKNENDRLKRSLNAVSVAAQAQSVLNHIEISGRDKIDGLNLGKTLIPKPDEVVNEEDSRRVIDLFNADIFSPWPDGVRSEVVRPGAFLMPGPGSAGLIEIEPG